MTNLFLRFDHIGTAIGRAQRKCNPFLDGAGELTIRAPSG
jgi:hypothetical protein